MPKPYKVIFFDWYKTLSRSDFWYQLLDEHHPRHHWHDEIFDFLFVRNKVLLEKWLRGMMTEEEIMRAIARATHFDPEKLQQDLAESCRNMQFVSDEVLPLVQALRRRGVKCVIATDNMDTFEKYIVPTLRLEEHFDGILSSFNLKTLKLDVQLDPPKIPFFDPFLQQYGYNYQEALLLDDHVDTSGVYEQVGFDMFQVTDPEPFLQKLRELAGV